MLYISGSSVSKDHARGTSEGLTSSAVAMQTDACYDHWLKLKLSFY